MNSTLAPANGTGNRTLPDPVANKTIVSRPGRSHADDYFFSAMSLVILATVLLGFAHTYYLAGTVRAHLPSVIIHIHGAVYSAWILLFPVQVALVATGRVRWHMQLGIFGAFIATLMFVLGIVATFDSMRRGFTPPGLDPARFLAVNMINMGVFGALVFWGLAVRRNPAAHKRLILLATISLVAAPVSRWPFAFIQHFPPATGLIVNVFLLVVIAFDVVTRKRPHLVTVCGSAMIFAIPALSFGLLGPSSFWRHFTDWVKP